jgi:S1-C subfamily serine protease
VSAHIRVLSGARAGLTVPLSQARVTLGRHPEMDVRFSVDEDLGVSARHALIEYNQGRWFVRDLGSTNGTLVNATEILSDTPLADGDRINLGRRGPLLEFRLEPASDPWRLRTIVAAFSLLLIFASVTFLTADHYREADRRRERAQLDQRADSMRGASDSMQRQLSELSAALVRSRAEVLTTRSRLERAESSGDVEQIATLRHQLQIANTAVARQQLAAELDFLAIQQGNRRAIARVYTETESGAVATATAFAIRADGTLLTNRHVLTAGTNEMLARRVGVQFSDSHQVWPARVVAVSNEADLGLVKVDNIEGDVPVVRALNAHADTVGVGAPVALIGFALGGAEAPPPSGVSPIARPLVSAGVIMSVTPDRLELQGYGAAGASGSPVFDATGAVIGVLFGGQRSAASGTTPLLAVPIASVLRLLATVR